MCTHLPSSSYGCSVGRVAVRRALGAGGEVGGWWPGAAGGAGCPPWCRCRWRTWWRTWPGSRRPAPGSARGRGRRCGGLCRTGRASSCAPKASTRAGSSVVDAGDGEAAPTAAACWTRSARAAGVQAGAGAGANPSACGGRRGGSGRGSGRRRAAGTRRPWRTARSRPPPSRVTGDAELVGDQAAQGDGEPAPQVRGAALPDDVRLRSRSSPGTAAAPALGRPRRALGAAGRVGRGRRAAASRTGDGSGRCGRGGRGRVRTTGAVRVANTSGLSATDCRDGLPPVTPARIRWNMSAAYSRAARRALRRAPVAAPHVGHPERLVGARSTSPRTSPVVASIGLRRTRPAGSAWRSSRPGPAPRTSRRSPATPRKSATDAAPQDPAAARPRAPARGGGWGRRTRSRTRHQGGQGVVDACPGP